MLFGFTCALALANPGEAKATEESADSSVMGNKKQILALKQDTRAIQDYLQQAETTNVLQDTAAFLEENEQAIRLVSKCLTAVWDEHRSEQQRLEEAQSCMKALPEHFVAMEQIHKSLSRRLNAGIASLDSGQRVSLVLNKSREVLPLLHLARDTRAGLANRLISAKTHLNHAQAVLASMMKTFRAMRHKEASLQASLGSAKLARALKALGQTAATASLRSELASLRDVVDRSVVRGFPFLADFASRGAVRLCKQVEDTRMPDLCDYIAQKAKILNGALKTPTQILFGSIQLESAYARRHCKSPNACQEIEKIAGLSQSQLDSLSDTELLEIERRWMELCARD